MNLSTPNLPHRTSTPTTFHTGADDDTAPAPEPPRRPPRPYVESKYSTLSFPSSLSFVPSFRDRKSHCSELLSSGSRAAASLLRASVPRFSSSFSQLGGSCPPWPWGPSPSSSSCSRASFLDRRGRRLSRSFCQPRRLSTIFAEIRSLLSFLHLSPFLFFSYFLSAFMIVFSREKLHSPRSSPRSESLVHPPSFPFLFFS